MRDLFDSVVRTFVPIIVGSVVAFLVARGVVLDEAFESALTVFVGSLFSGGYYLVARVLEVYVSPRFGWLLGLMREPSYNTTDTVTDDTASV